MKRPFLKALAVFGALLPMLPLIGCSTHTIRGPGPLPRWVQTSGPTGGVVECLAVSGSSLFAGTHDGGVYRSTDNGANWTAVNSGLTDTPIHALATNGAGVFAGTDAGVFRSSDNGASWSAVNSGLTSTDVHALAVRGTSLFAGTQGRGVWRRRLY
jgi:ligand-binding sensor domain-containing protein